MWLIMAGCLLLPAAFLLFGGRYARVGLTWGWLALIGAFILIHVLMVFSHGRHDEKEAHSSDSAASTDNDKAIK